MYDGDRWSQMNCPAINTLTCKVKCAANRGKRLTKVLSASRTGVSEDLAGHTAGCNMSWCMCSGKQPLEYD